MIDVSKQLKVPPLDPYFFVQEEDRINMDRLEKLSDKHPVNILVTGNQGCGKSSLVKQFASYYKRPMVTFQIGLLLEAGQLFGQQRLKEGETFYQSFLFSNVIRVPGCVIHLEEINRSENPHALNELFSVLSEDRSIWIDEFGLVEVAPRVIFFATMNEGAGFSGTDEVDAALKDRFYRVRLEYPPMSVEKEILILKTGVTPSVADEILNVVNKLRHNKQAPVDVSIRHSLMIAELAAMGTPLREAIIYSLQISMNILESLLLSIHVEMADTKEELSHYERYVPLDYVPSQGG
ncbi:MAG: AAA family ATPase [Syntrophaceae bacterium]|nr:AAA family ATPase [Syntrophaceae bacterium]